MKVRRYFADDMAQGLKMVREQQGPDAVIISNKRVEGGIELVAAEDYDDRLMQAKQKEARAPRSKPVEEQALALEAERRNLSVDDEMETPVISEEKPAKSDFKEKLDEAASRSQPVAEKSKNGPQMIWTHEPMIDQMQQELSSLRGLLEQQISGLAWGSFGQQHPLRASLLRKLTTLGLDTQVSRQLVNQVPENLQLEEAWYRLLGVLASSLPVDSDSILTQGGMFALVGPPGAGKTTLVCKLAARHALIHGKDSVALISTDNLRIGAYEQLRGFGRIAGIPVWSAADGVELQQALEHVYHRRLVLIDTAGIGHKSSRLMQQLELLGDCSHLLKTCLVLPSTMQSLALEHLIDAYRSASPSNCVITHLDEAASLGPVLSAIINHKLPVSYVSTGQSIPEDIKAVKARELIAAAVNVYQQTDTAIEDTVLEKLFVEEKAHAQH